MKLPLLFSFLFIHCITYGQTRAKEIRSNLTGRWDWVKTEIIDRSGGGTSTPSSCQCNMYLIFDGRSVKQYKNDTLIFNEPYSLEEIYFMQDPVKVMLRSHALTNQILMKGDSIAMGPFGGCGAIDSYKKLSSNQSSK